MLAVQIIGVAALVAGVVLVARAPALADLRPAQLAPRFPARLRIPPPVIPEPPIAPLDGQTARQRASHQE